MTSAFKLLSPELLTSLVSLLPDVPHTCINNLYLAANLECTLNTITCHLYTIVHWYNASLLSFRMASMFLSMTWLFLSVAILSRTIKRIHLNYHFILSNSMIISIGLNSCNTSNVLYAHLFVYTHPQCLQVFSICSVWVFIREKSS